MLAVLFAAKLVGWLLAGAAIVAAVIVLWKAAEWFGRFTERADTLEGIAREFRPNGGNSLRDVINVVQASANTAATVAQTAALAAATAETHALESVAASKENTEQLVELNSYMHDFVHTNRNMTTVMAGHMGMLTDAVSKLQLVIYERAEHVREGEPPRPPTPIPPLKLPDK